MNLNETVMGKEKGIKMNKGFKPGFMGPPLRLPPKKKSSSSSSTLNWGKSQVSVLNSSSVFWSGGSSKSSTDVSECRIVLALTEGRGDARCEVGLASLNVPRATLVVCQISDTPSYINTLTKINILNPSELVVPVTFVENACKARLMDLIKQHFPEMRIVTLARSAFNKSNGIDRIQYLCLPELKSLLLSLHYKYYALCAASAVLMYAQNTLNVYYAADTIKLDYQESEGFAVIDVWTADRLELVSSTRPAQATKYSTLFGVLNNCMTKAGSRTLRSAILQPPCLPSIIEERLNCITELIENPGVMLSIQQILQKVSNIDQLLTVATMFPNNEQNCSYRQLNYLLMLNSVLDLIAPLHDALEKTQQPFFVELRNLLSSGDFNKLRDLVREMIHKDAHYARGQGGDTQRCFIIKPGVNGLLDSVRKIYSERIEETVNYVKRLAEKYNLPLTLGNNASKGYHIILALKGQQKRYFNKSDLPREFIQVFRLAGSFTMKTLELINLSTRIDDVMMDIIKLSNLMVHKILVEVKKYFGLFYKLCESIAILDMYQSLAQASIGSGYAKPVFGDFTDVRFSHHPMLDYLCSTRPVPNSFASCNYFNFHILTGPNGSGKSVFIRQVVLLQIMAQVGCYLPAQSAIFKPADRIYARVYLEDNMECGASAFTLEMKEIKYIMTTMTSNSLIIIDELCRSTSVEEGTALAIAICEKLSRSSAFVYVTTHYSMLTKLQKMYYNIKIWKMETEAHGDTPESTIFDFKYTIQPGVTSLERYGVYMVRNIWPHCLVKEIDEMIDAIHCAPKRANFMVLDDKLRLKYQLEATFSRLKSEGKLTKAKVNTVLNTYISDLEKMNVSLVRERSPRQINQDFISNLQSNCVLSQISALDSLPEFSIHNDSDIACTEKMLQNFTPEMMNRSLNSWESGSLQENRFFEPFIYNDSASYDSSYKHLSEFIGENSENITKLIPEVVLKSSSRSDIFAQESRFCFDHSYDEVPELNRTGSSESIDLAHQPCDHRQPYIHNDYHTSIDIISSIDVNEAKLSTRFVQSSFGKEGTSTFLNMTNQWHRPSSIINANTSEIIPSNSSDKQSSEKSCSEEKVPPSNCERNTLGISVVNKSACVDDDDINEAIEDMKSCSDIFFEEDMELDMDSSYKSAEQQEIPPTSTVSEIKCYEKSNGEEVESLTTMTDQEVFFTQEYDTSVTELRRNNIQEHIFPEVIIREGRNDDSKSFGQEGSDGEDVYYSALETDDVEQIEKHRNLAQLWNLPMKDQETVRPKDVSKKTYEPVRVYKTATNSEDESNESNNIYSSIAGRTGVINNNPLGVTENVETIKITSDDSEQLLNDNETHSCSNIAEATSSTKGTEIEIECEQFEGKRSPSSINNIHNCDVKNSAGSSSSYVIECCDNNSSENENVDHTVTASSKEKSNISCIKSPERSIKNNEAENITSLEEAQDANAEEHNATEYITCNPQNDDGLFLRNTEHIDKHEVNMQYCNAEHNGKAKSEYNAMDDASTKLSYDIATTYSTKTENNKSNIDRTDSSSEISLGHANYEISKQSTSTSSIKETNSSSDTDNRKGSKAVKRKFKPPRKTDNSSTPTDDVTCALKQKRFKPTSRFITPKKLTKREIIEELSRQERTLIEEAEKNPDQSSKYLQKWLNRPSVSQIQNATILTHVCKTAKGIIEVPTVEPKKPSRMAKPLPLLRSASAEHCDVSIFSDKNAEPFEEFLKSKEKDYKLFNFDFKSKSDFKLLPSQLSGMARNNPATSSSSKTHVHERKLSILSVENVQLLTRLQQRSSMELPAAKAPLTIDGYYEQNQTEIETLIHKYANRDIQENIEPVSAPAQRKSIFEDAASTEFNL